MPQNKSQFYMVWNPNGKAHPLLEHPTAEAAIRESERLAADNPSHPFYVLKAIKVSRSTSTLTEDLQPFGQSDARPGYMGGGASPGY